MQSDRRGPQLHWQGTGPEMKREGGIYRSMPLTSGLMATRYSGPHHLRLKV
jgi:hypothetical protein